jgi:shikimate dehydrogenase
MPSQVIETNYDHRVNGATRLIGLLGDPVQQARSPALFNNVFEVAHLDRLCVALHVAAGGLVPVFAGLREVSNLDALLITTPHKRAIMPLLDHLSETSRKVGAVNVASRDSAGGWTGTTFDGEGTVLGLRWENVEVRGKRVLLVGAGGAGRAIAMALARAFTASIVILDIIDAAATDLAEMVHSTNASCTSTINATAADQFDICINASSVGMKGESELPIETRWLNPGTCIVDLTGEPEQTALGKTALAAGCRVFGGKLVHEGQAVLAARFLGFDFTPAGRPKISLDDFFDDRVSVRG